MHVSRLIRRSLSRLAAVALGDGAVDDAKVAA
jgi:hypothetical protein